MAILSKNTQIVIICASLFVGVALVIYFVSKIVERKTRFELATFSLARRRSTTELLPLLVICLNNYDANTAKCTYSSISAEYLSIESLNSKIPTVKCMVKHPK